MLRAIALLAFSGTLSLLAQPKPDDLFRTVEALDAAVFDAYNNCSPDKFASYFTDDVEFYHDQAGLSTGLKDLTDALKKNICGKVRRELVRESLEVHPMKGYGAVEIGVHRFYHPGAGDNDTPGVARFIHLWQQQKDGSWKITRVISFDHKSLAKPAQ